MTTKLFIMTAALAVAGSVSAFAWDASQLKANIDFPFKAFSVNLPAGHYDVVKTNSSGTAIFHLRETNTHAGVLLVGHAISNGKPERPRMTFRCSSSMCGLTELSTGTGTTYLVTSPKWSLAEKERLVTVYLDRVNGE